MAEAILASSGIYQILNTVNGKMYVGSAVNLSKRKVNHFHELRSNKHHSRKLQNAWIKHGESAFIFEILEVVDDRNLLVNREQHWIDTLNVFGEHGYNMTPKAGSCIGVKHGADARNRMSLAHKGNTASEETKRRMSESRIGHTFSEESKAKMRETYKKRVSAPSYVNPNIGRKMTPEATAKRLVSRGSVKHTDESKARISKGRAGIIPVWKNPEERARNISNARIGYVMPDSTKKLLSIAHKGRCLLPIETQAEIKRLFSAGMTRIAIARKTGVHRHTVGTLIAKAEN